MSDVIQLIRNWNFLLMIGLTSFGCSQSRPQEPDRIPARVEGTMISTPSIQYDGVRPSSTVPKQEPVEREKKRRDVRPPAREKKTPDTPEHWVTLDELRMYVKDRSAILIDARSPESFAEGHVMGAINIPAVDAEAQVMTQLQHVDRDQLMIVYCSSVTCHSSDYLYEYLLSMGFTNVGVFSPGWAVLSSATELQ